MGPIVGVDFRNTENLLELQGTKHFLGLPVRRVVTVPPDLSRLSVRTRANVNMQNGSFDCSVPECTNDRLDCRSGVWRAALHPLPSSHTWRINKLANNGLQISDSSGARYSVSGDLTSRWREEQWIDSRKKSNEAQQPRSPLIKYCIGLSGKLLTFAGYTHSAKFRFTYKPESQC